MASQNGHFLIRRVLISGLGHDENLLSNYSLFEKGFSPLSLGAKQNQFAEMLNISTRQLHRMRSKGTIIQPIKLGRMTRWSLEEVEEWIRTGCPLPVHQDISRGR
jgi:predicted DNA-binding transcriptional regulator AlpA